MPWRFAIFCPASSVRASRFSEKRLQGTAPRACFFNVVLRRLCRQKLACNLDGQAQLHLNLFVLLFLQYMKVDEPAAQDVELMHDSKGNSPSVSRDCTSTHLLSGQSDHVPQHIDIDVFVVRE
jgi:hypothetical protein